MNDYNEYRVPFTERFQLLDLKRDEGARTYEAREIATGRPVFVHLFADTTSPINQALLAKIDALPEEERSRILDRGPHEGGIYIVTDRLAEYLGLREWLKAKNEKPLEAGGAWKIVVPPPPPVDSPSPFDTAPLPAVEPSIVSPPPSSNLGNSGEQTLHMPIPVLPPPANEPGEFTRQFAPPVLRPTPPPPKISPPPAPPPANEPGEFTRQFAPVLRPAPPPPPRVDPAPPPPAATEPGEFTRQFAPPVLRPTAPVPPKAGEFTQLFSVPGPQKTAPPPPSNPGTTPGEFTQMLQAQRPTSRPPAANPPPSEGEFTRFFESPMSPSSQQTPMAPPFRPPSQPKDAGEFTQIFGQGDMPSAPPPPTPAALPPSASANATQVFATPRQTPVPQNLNRPMGPTVPQAPGEYTQMFAKPAPLTFGQAPSAPQAPRVQEVRIKRNDSRLPLLLVLGGVVLLMLAILVYFLMRPHSA